MKIKPRTKKLVSNQFHPGYELNSRVFVLTNDSKLLISGAHWDNSLRVFSLSKNRNVAHFFQHSGKFRYFKIKLCKFQALKFD